MSNATDFFTITWGRIRLWASKVTTDNSRRQIVHELSSGDRHPVQDMGLKPRITTLDLMFDDFPSETSSPTNRFRTLKAEVDAGTRAIYTHPIDGGFLARVGSFTYDIDADNVITNCRIEFIADEVVDAVKPAGAGAYGISGETSIEQASQDLSSALTDAELVWLTSDDEDITTKATSAVASWSGSDAVPTRQIVVDNTDVASNTGAMIEDLGLEDDLALFGVFRSVIMFADAMRSAAISATSETPTVFVVRVVAATSLLALCARTYGGSEAELRAAQIAELNDIRRSAWLSPGDYLFPTVTASAVARL